MGAIQKALTYRYSSHDVDKILASKEKFSKHPHNYAMFKAKLMKERDQYIDMGNQEEVECWYLECVFSTIIVIGWKDWM